MSFHSTAYKTYNELTKINNNYDKVPTKYLLSLYRRVQLGLPVIRIDFGFSIEDNEAYFKSQVTSLKEELDKREHIKRK